MCAEEITSLKGNSYLMMAYKAILAEKKPLSPKEIINFANNNGLMPDHLFGETPHKTLAARLSVYIRKEGKGSIFFRTAPAKYFLHSLALSSEISEEYKTVYPANPRSKTIRKENILVIDKDLLSKHIHGDFIKYDEKQFNDLYKNHMRFHDRALAEKNTDLKQFVTFILLHNQSKLLIYRRGTFTNTSERLKGKLSVGLGGHVNDGDFDLFKQGGDALIHNAARELKEELYLDEVYDNLDAAIERVKILGYVNVDTSPDAKQHIAVLVSFDHISEDLPTKGELSINQLAWLDMSQPDINLSEFDLWSKIILQEAIKGNLNIFEEH